MIKKMRLQGIADYEAANRYLGERYLPEHNAKFACEPAAEADFHQRLSKRLELKWVFCLEAEPGVKGLERWIARKFSVAHAWRARAARRKARQFYRESRRRCREFGGPRNLEGGGDKRRDPRASNDKIDLPGRYA